MKNITLRFKYDMAELVEDDKKHVTTRPYPAGQVGDTFLLRVCLYTITEVRAIKLIDVALNWFTAEGFTTPIEFSNYWTMLHPKKGYIDSQLVYLHFFERRN